MFEKKLDQIVHKGALLLCLMSLITSTHARAAETLVSYSASTGLPPTPPWEFVSNGGEMHIVFVDSGVLHLIDTTLLIGDSLGYIQSLTLNPNQIIDVEFRCRVLAGQSVLDDRAPFSVGLYNGKYVVDLSVGPSSVTALGGSEASPTLILNRPFDGTEWHTYHYTLTPTHLTWFADGVSLGSVGVDTLIAVPHPPRISMLISSATGNLELDYLIVQATTLPNQPPACSGAYPSIANLWPPNHQFVPIQVLGVTDPDGDPVTITITAIRQDEPLKKLGNGSSIPDATGVGTATAYLRAERSGTAKVPGNGRVYHVFFTASDGQGGECSGEVLVGVPPNPTRPVIDNGALYDSTAR